MKTQKKIESYFLYGAGICKKCGTKDVGFTSKGNLVHHNGCFCRTALKPVGFLQSTKKEAI